MSTATVLHKLEAGGVRHSRSPRFRTPKGKGATPQWTRFAESPSGGQTGPRPRTRRRRLAARVGFRPRTRDLPQFRRKPENPNQGTLFRRNWPGIFKITKERKGKPRNGGDAAADGRGLKRHDRDVNSRLPTVSLRQEHVAETTGNPRRGRLKGDSRGVAGLIS